MPEPRTVSPKSVDALPADAAKLPGAEAVAQAGTVPCRVPDIAS